MFAPQFLNFKDKTNNSGYLQSGEGDKACVRYFQLVLNSLGTPRFLLKVMGDKAGRK